MRQSALSIPLVMTLSLQTFPATNAAWEDYEQAAMADGRTLLITRRQVDRPPSKKVHHEYRFVVRYPDGKREEVWRTIMTDLSEHVGRWGVHTATWLDDGYLALALWDHKALDIEVIDTRPGTGRPELPQRPPSLVLFSGLDGPSLEPVRFGGSVAGGTLVVSVNGRRATGKPSPRREFGRAELVKDGKGEYRWNVLKTHPVRK